MLEDSESNGDDVKRVMFVEEQKVSAAGYAVGTSTTANEENKAAEPAEADDGADERDEEEQKRQAEIVELSLNWSRNFLERGGFQFVLS